MSNPNVPIFDQPLKILEGRFLVSKTLVPEMPWAEGSIEYPAELDDELMHTAIGAIAEGIVEVHVDDEFYSGCTDGRGRLGVLDKAGTPDDIRDTQKLAGSDNFTAFAAAELLGKTFYGKFWSENVMERYSIFLNYAEASGLVLGDHEGCGMRLGFATVMENIIRFGEHAQYYEVTEQRLRHFIGKVGESALYGGNNGLIHAAIDGAKSIVDSYDAYDADEAQRMVIERSGPRNVEVLDTVTFRHNNGHGEMTIEHLDIDPNIINALVTLSSRKLAKKLPQLDPRLKGRGAFAINDDRIRMLARRPLFSPYTDGVRSRIVLPAAFMHIAGDSAHATLSNGLPTYKTQLIQ